ncbi:MAG: Hpt domain-containing protein [Planctomycetota bacterium]|nr:MAG: Hpt domain-containing protein [Planctomycetota bacterium]
MSTPTTSTPVDPSRLQELRDLFGDEEEIRLLFIDFFSELPGRLETLETALGHNAREGVERAAHALSGSAGSLGAMASHKAAKELEEAARSGQEGLEELAARLRAELDRLRSWAVQEGLLPQE